MTDPAAKPMRPDTDVLLPELEAVPKRVPAWRFWTPLAIQLLLLVSVPAQSAYTYVTGRTIVLETAPVDPYDFLRGYFQILSYQVSDLAALKALPGGAEVFADPTHQSFYLVLEAPADAANEGQPAPWQPVRVSHEKPDLAENQVVLQGQTNQWGDILYGLESYYMPEDQRLQLNADISEIQQQDPQAFRVEVKVDSRGNAVPISLWIADENYRF